MRARCTAEGDAGGQQRGAGLRGQLQRAGRLCPLPSPRGLPVVQPLGPAGQHIQVVVQAPAGGGGGRLLAAAGRALLGQRAQRHGLRALRRLLLPVGQTARRLRCRRGVRLLLLLRLLLLGLLRRRLPLQRRQRALYAARLLVLLAASQVQVAQPALQGGGGWPAGAGQGWNRACRLGRCSAQNTSRRCSGQPSSAFEHKTG